MASQSVPKNTSPTAIGQGMYSADVEKLPQLAKNKAWARLQTIDGKTVYDFLVNPSEIRQQYSVDLSALAIAGAANPLQKYKSSSMQLSIPTFLMLSPASDRDLSKPLAQLTFWTQPDNDGKLPVLKFIWGASGLERCYLANLSFTVTRSIGGRPTEVRGSFDLVPAPDTPKLRSEFSGGDIFTDRERTDLLGRVQAAIRRNKEWMKEKGIYDDTQIEVTPEGKVVAKNKGSSTTVDLGPFNKILEFLTKSPT